MKINETIRQRRIERNLTQEQVANYLGVISSCSQKWGGGTLSWDINTFTCIGKNFRNGFKHVIIL